jgi:Pvc16 N-terminal domain
MSLADSSKAIGAVTQALKERLDKRTGRNVRVGRLDQGTGTGEHLNLFLYEIAFDPHLKNTSLNESEKPPVWLVLKYLLTAFENTTDSDSPTAHEILGAAIRAIHQDDLLKLDGLATSTAPLTSNPSELHVTFDDSSADLVAKLTQGTDETPRLSIAFQVRPVMIASGEPGNYSLLVGVDYTKPPVALSPSPVGLDVIPSMGAFIAEISPTGFEVDEVVTIRGTDLHLANLSASIGTVELPLVMQQPDELRFRVDAAIIGASGISAGSHPVTVVQTFPGSGKKRRSNAVIGNLVPTLSSAVIAAPGATIVPGVPPDLPDKAYATIDLGGSLLGNKHDDVILAFYRDARVYKMFDVFSALPDPQPHLQPDRQIVMVEDDAVPTGDYNLILLVNGQQAPQSPLVAMHTP